MEKEAVFYDKNPLETPETYIKEDGTVVRGETEYWDRSEDRRPQAIAPESEEN